MCVWTLHPAGASKQNCVATCSSEGCPFSLCSGFFSTQGNHDYSYAHVVGKSGQEGSFTEVERQPREDATSIEEQSWASLEAAADSSAVEFSVEYRSASLARLCWNPFTPGSSMANAGDPLRFAVDAGPVVFLPQPHVLGKSKCFSNAGACRGPGGR